MTPETKALFTTFAQDACNWSGTPLLDIAKEQRGNLSDLKKRGLIETFKDAGCDWVDFTDEGKRLAAKLGYTI